MSTILVRNSSLVMMPSPSLSKNSAKISLSWAISSYEKIFLNLSICSSVDMMEMGEPPCGEGPQAQQHTRGGGLKTEMEMHETPPRRRSATCPTVHTLLDHGDLLLSKPVRHPDGWAVDGV